MGQVAPLQGWRFDPGKVAAGDVLIPPTPQITPELRQRLYRRHPRNVVRLVAGLDYDGDDSIDNRHTRAAAHLDAWREESLFQQDRPSLYLYEQDLPGGGQLRRGFLARLLLNDWEADGVAPLQRVACTIDTERLQTYRHTRGQVEPVVALLSDPEGEVLELLETLVDYAPLADLPSEHGLGGARLWVVDHPDRVDRLLRACATRRAAVLQRHDLYQTALAYRDEVRERLRLSGQTPPPLGHLDSDWVLALFVADGVDALCQQPQHRLVRNLPTFSADEFETALRKRLKSRRAAETATWSDLLTQAEPPAIGLVLPGQRSVLTLRDPAIMSQRAKDASAEWRRLPSSVLHLLILEDLLGLNEQDILRGEQVLIVDDAQAAERAVEAGKAQVGFILPPPEAAAVRECVTRGHVLPPGTVHSGPGVPGGLVLNLFW